VPGSLGGRAISFASAEDTVLTKLEWALLASSERQYEDASAIVRLQATAIDQAHLDRWASELGVAELLRSARRGAPFRGS